MEACNKKWETSNATKSINNSIVYVFDVLKDRNYSDKQVIIRNIFLVSMYTFYPRTHFHFSRRRFFKCVSSSNSKKVILSLQCQANFRSKLISGYICREKTHYKLIQNLIEISPRLVPCHNTMCDRQNIQMCRSFATRSPRSRSNY